MLAEPLGVITAGGAGRRMGADKAGIEVGGVAMIDRVAAALRAVVADVVVVGRESAPPGLAAAPDDRPARRGPLAGLATALRIAGGRGVLFVAVDQPLVRTATLRHLMDLGRRTDSAVVPVADGARQVTCAFYPGGWSAEAAAEDDACGSIQSLLDRMPAHEVGPETWQAWGEDGRSWLSVDTPADIAHAETLLAGQ